MWFQVNAVVNVPQNMLKHEVREVKSGLVFSNGRVNSVSSSPDKSQVSIIGIMAGYGLHSSINHGALYSTGKRYFFGSSKDPGRESSYSVRTGSFLHCSKLTCA